MIFKVRRLENIKEVSVEEKRVKDWVLLFFSKSSGGEGVISKRSYVGVISEVGGK